MKRFILILFTVFCTPVFWSQGQAPFSRVCEAKFIYQQDPQNHLIVNFTNQSLGIITSYFWDFGDGSFSFGENPSHAFPYTGEFKVCLTVSNNDTANPCFDTTCMTVNVDVPATYQIGGLLFAGAYPINNPVPTGDTAFAFLYEYRQSAIVPIDSVLFDTLGYIMFDGVKPGKYCLKAGLAEHSARFSMYIPAYFGDQLLWADCDTLKIVNHSIYNAHIRMIETTLLNPGPGHIQGSMLVEGSPGGMVPLINGQIVLADSQGNPLQYKYSGTDGEFLFDLMPPRSYQLFAEYTGMYSQKLDVTLDNNNPSADSLTVRIYSQLPGITELPSNPVSVALFPNPADQLLHIQFRLLTPEEFVLSVYNTLGKTVYSETLEYPAGQFQKTLNLNGFPANLYVVSFGDIDSEWQVMKKFIKK
ncbi:MAG: PKD domain-containing protein [bacterium]